jgi:SAM-dependent methyltransferase
VGRFETSAEFYTRYREPYPPELFRAVAERVPLRGTERLLDAACGPAMLAIGFAPYVKSCMGVDVEATMIGAAREAAAEAGVAIELIQSRLEDLPNSVGVFDVATIGRALHWLDRDAALAAFDRLLSPGASIVVCTALATGERFGPLETPSAPDAADDHSPNWMAEFTRVRESWAVNFNRAFYQIKLDDWFAGSRFRRRDQIKLTYRHPVTIPHLIGRALSMSPTSPAALGERRQAFEAAIAATLEPHARAGVLEEEVAAKADIFG